MVFADTDSVKYTYNESRSGSSSAISPRFLIEQQMAANACNLIILLTTTGAHTQNKIYYFGQKLAYQ